MAKDLTQGRIMPMLIKFTIPLILGNIFQLTVRCKIKLQKVVNTFDM